MIKLNLVLPLFLIVLLLVIENDAQNIAEIKKVSFSDNSYLNGDQICIMKSYIVLDSDTPDKITIKSSGVMVVYSLLYSITEKYDQNLYKTLYVGDFETQQGVNSISIFLEFANGSISDLLSLGTNTCWPIPSAHATPTYPNTLFPKRLNFYFLRIPSIVSTWYNGYILFTMNPGSPYVGNIRQSPYDTSFFIVQLYLDTLATPPVEANFTLQFSSSEPVNYSVSSSMRAWDDIIGEYNISMKLENVYTKAQPFCSFMIGVQGDPRQVYFEQPALSPSGSLFREYVKGNPMTSSLLVNTYVISINSMLPNIPLPISIIAYNGIAGPLELETVSVNHYAPSLITQLPIIDTELGALPGGTRYIVCKTSIQTDAMTQLEIKITNSKGTIADYPFGFKSGNLKNVDIVVSYVLPPYFSAYNPQFSVEYPILTSSAPTPFIPIQIDSTPPIIHSIDITPLDKGKYLLLADISDDLSGFHSIEFNGKVILQASNIIQGTMISGLYEAIIDQNDLLFINQIKVVDFGFSFSSFPDGYYNSKADRVQLIGSLFIPSNIKLFKFEYYNLDLSISGAWNTLYFNYEGAGPYSKIIFYPIIVVSEHSVIDNPDIYTDPQYQYEWDIESKSFKIRFYLPAGLYSKNINYMVGDLSGTRLYAFDDFYNLIGSDAVLNVSSIDANQMFPYVTEFEIIGTSVIYLNGPTQTANIGWRITIETLKHPLKYATFMVTSDYNPQGVNYTFVPSQSMNKSPFNGVYEILFQVDGDSISQEYQISFVLFEDKVGRKSGINNPKIGDAFLKFHNTSFYPIKVNCLPISDTTSPVLTGWAVSTQTFNSMSGVNVFSIDFETQDVDSPLSLDHIPVVYLTPPISQSKYQCKTRLLGSTPGNKTATYRAHCIPPYGFGFPLGFSFSIYGIVDKYMNVGGYSSSDLLNDNRQHYMNAPTPSFSTPVLIQGQSDGGNVTLTGHHFGVANESVQIFIYPDNADTIQISAPLFKYFSNLQFSFIFTSQTPFALSIQVKNIGSNTLRIIPKNKTDSSSTNSENTGSSMEPSSSSTSSHSIPKNIPCPGNPVCGGKDKGICLPNGGCKCLASYYGEDCTSVIIIIPKPDFKPNQPTTNITIDNNDIALESLISIVGLNELDQTGQIIKRMTFDQWIYTKINDDLHQYNTSIVGAIQTNISVWIEYFEEQQIIQFAGQNLTMYPSSIKYKIAITRYPFSSSLNMLQFVMAASFITPTNGECTYTDFNNTIEDSEYLRLQIDSHSLFGRFIKRGLLDDRPRVVTNSILENDGYTSFKNTSMGSSFIGMNLPFYLRTAIIDPDFSVLIDSNPASSKQGSTCATKKTNKLSGAKIAGIVIGCVAFVSIIVVAVSYHLYKKKKQLKFEKNVENKLKRFN
ncbi:hypothetical protein CYY_008091 [Polysphondylium violaceum]|uniref:EGF-like domain-containing protein n=1 Tax=Polysphondylium violaceum TaxID=133409 RepID=A0A8J4PW15_9MYCE|nr:hypothetical protein CYY_008091 [Polysphondylium violaceum]